MMPWPTSWIPKLNPHRISTIKSWFINSSILSLICPTQLLTFFVILSQCWIVSLYFSSCFYSFLCVYIFLLVWGGGGGGKGHMLLPTVRTLFFVFSCQLKRSHWQWASEMYQYESGKLCDSWKSEHLLFIIENLDFCANMTKIKNKK